MHNLSGRHHSAIGEGQYTKCINFDVTAFPSAESLSYPAEGNVESVYRDMSADQVMSHWNIAIHDLAGGHDNAVRERRYTRGT